MGVNTKTIMKNSQDSEAYRRARKQVDELKGFYMHLWVFVIFQGCAWIGYFAGVDLAREIGAFSLQVILLSWGVGLAFHAVHVFGVNVFFGHGWEERKIREFMKEEEDLMNSAGNSNSKIR